MAIAPERITFRWCGPAALAAVSAAHDGPIPPALLAAAQHGCATAWPALSARADGAVAEAVARQVVAGLARARRALGAAAALARLAAALEASRHAALRWRLERAGAEPCAGIAAERAGIAASRAGALNAGAALG